jgi:polyphosphate kinase
MQTPDVSNRRKTVAFSREVLPGGPTEPSNREQLPVSEPATAKQAPSNTGDQEPKERLLTDPTLYINRELSQLAFQWRVLQESFNASNPLLERFKFVSIVGSNLEEFFMVRVAGLKRQIEANSVLVGPDGLTPIEQLDAVKAEVVNLFDNAQECLFESLMPALRDTGIQILAYDALSPEQKATSYITFIQCSRRLR